MLLGEQARWNQSSKTIVQSRKAAPSTEDIETRELRWLNKMVQL